MVLKTWSTVELFVWTIECIVFLCNYSFRVSKSLALTNEWNLKEDEMTSGSGVHRKNMGISFVVVSFINILLFASLICDDTKGHFTDSWAVVIPGGIDKAQDLVRKYGFMFVDKVRIWTLC